MAECRGLAPLARRHALVSTEARFACPVDIPSQSSSSAPRSRNRIAVRGRRRRGILNGPHGRSCTCTVEGLSFVPLHWATRAEEMKNAEGSPRDSHSTFFILHSPVGNGAHGRICTDTVRVLSALSLRWTTWAKWCRVRDFHPQPLRSERSVSCR